MQTIEQRARDLARRLVWFQANAILQGDIDEIVLELEAAARDAIAKSEEVPPQK